MKTRLWPLFLIGLLFLGCANGSGTNPAGKADSLLNLGVSYMHRDKPEMALEKLLEAERLAPKDPKIQNHLGLTYLQLDQNEQALSHFYKALSLDPDYSEVHNNLAWANIRMGRYSEAVVEAGRALENLTYNTPEFAYNNQGLAYYKMGQNEKAVEAYQMALRKSPRFSTAFNNLGQSYMALDKVDEAIQAFNNAIKYQPRDSQAYYNLGSAFEQSGKITEARLAFKKVTELAPNSSLGKKASERLKALPQ